MPVTKTKIIALIEDMKNEEPEIRYHALAEFSELKEEPFETNLLTLERLVKEAAHPFPEPVADWDHPSFYILDFVFQYEVPELIDSIVTHYSRFSEAGKILVLQYFCRIGDDTSFRAVLNILDRDLQTKEAVILVEEFCSQPLWSKKIIERYYGYLQDEEYKFPLYRILLFCLRNNLFHQFKPGFILPLLLEDYQEAKKAYMEYNDSYNIKYVYTSWKAIYPKLQAEMDFYLSLMEYYFNEETEAEVREAVTFLDPMIQTSAVIVCLQKNIPVDGAVLLHCATNIISSEILYWELIRIRKEHLFPIQTNKQRYFAKSHLFHFLVSEAELDYFPENIEIVESVDTKDYFGNPVRYYLATFENEHKEKLVAWVGAYNLEEHDDSCYIFENTFITDGLFQERTVAQHTKRLLDLLHKEDKEYDERIHYISSPRLSKWYYIWYPIIAYRWYQAISEQDIVYIVLSTLLTALVVGYHFYKIKESKTKQVELKGYLLRYHNKNNISDIHIQDIKKILIEKASKKVRLFDMGAKVIAIYNKKEKKVMEIPLQCVVYHEFTYVIKELSSYLEETPYMDGEVN